MNGKQAILAVDDSGKFLEYIPKEIGHKGEGKRHLAITVLLVNEKGQFLLQRRKHKIFDNLWDFTGATHPLHKPHSCHSEEPRQRRDKLHDVGIYANQDCHALRARNDRKCRICNKDNVDENLEEATRRCLKREWDISPTSPRLRRVKEIGAFNYFAPYRTVQGDYCENEHCYLMVGEYDGEINLNPEVGYEYKWLDKKKFLKDVEQNPRNHVPWVIEGVKVLKKML